MKSPSSIPPYISAFARILKVAVHLAFCLSIFGQAAITQAASITDNEIKLLPPYCEARLKRTPAYAEWARTLGPDFIHTHHLCEGMLALNRYQTANTKLAKQTALNNAMGNLDYMVRNANPQYSLMPEVFTNRGQVFAHRGNTVQALIDLQKAIELNPKTVRAYTLAVELLSNSKKTDEALKLATEGLRHNADSRVLQRQYDRLGGSKPYPEAISNSPERTETTRKSVTNDKVVLPEPVSATPNSSQATNTEEANTTAVKGKNMENAGSPPPPVGTPSNPWCRFCPDSK